MLAYIILGVIAVVAILIFIRYSSFNFTYRNYRQYGYHKDIDKVNSPEDKR